MSPNLGRRHRASAVSTVSPSAVWTLDNPGLRKLKRPDGDRRSSRGRVEGRQIDRAVDLRFAGASGDGFRRLLHGAYPQSSYERMNARRIARGKRSLALAFSTHT